MVARHITATTNHNNSYLTTWSRDRPRTRSHDTDKLVYIKRTILASAFLLSQALIKLSCRRETARASGWRFGFSGNALACINVVALRQARLVRGWVTVCGKPSWYVTSQLANSAFHLYGVDKSSTNLPGWSEVEAVSSVGWQMTLCDYSPEAAAASR